MLEDRAQLPPARLAEIERLVADHRTLEDVTRWALSQRPPRVFSRARAAMLGDAREVEANGPGFDLVVQDEYTHDVVVPYDDELFLVYDTT